MIYALVFEANGKISTEVLGSGSASEIISKVHRGTWSCACGGLLFVLLNCICYLPAGLVVEIVYIEKYEKSKKSTHHMTSKFSNN